MNSDTNDITATPATPSMDFLLAADTHTLAILGPDKQPVGWNFTLAGPAHPVSKRLADEMLQESLTEKRAIAMAQANGKPYEPPTETAAQVRERNGRRLSARILGWNPVTIGGQPFEYSAANALKLATDPQLRFVFEQVLTYLGGEKAFLASSANS